MYFRDFIQTLLCLDITKMCQPKRIHINLKTWKWKYVDTLRQLEPRIYNFVANPPSFSTFRASEKQNHSVIGLSNVQWAQSVKWKCLLRLYSCIWHVSNGCYMCAENIFLRFCIFFAINNEKYNACSGTCNINQCVNKIVTLLTMI